MSGRFRLDPREARVEDVAAPAPPPTPVARPPPAPLPAFAPPPAPRPAPAAAAPAPAPARNKRALLLGAVIVGLLLVGGGIAVYVATAQGYPDAYLLERREYPAGLSKASLSQDDMDELGLRSNPGQVDRQTLSDESFTSEEPEEGHALVLEDRSGARIAVFALRYADEDAATGAAREARAICSFLGGGVLRDGDILVAILSQDGASREQVSDVANALRAKTPDLRTVC